MEGLVSQFPPRAVLLYRNASPAEGKQPCEDPHLPLDIFKGGKQESRLMQNSSSSRMGTLERRKAAQGGQLVSGNSDKTSPWGIFLNSRQMIG